MKLETMSSIPARSNPQHHDLERTLVNINRRFSAMHMGGNNGELVIIDRATGQRVKLVFDEVKTTFRPSLHKKLQSIKSWVNIKA